MHVFIRSAMTPRLANNEMFRLRSDLFYFLLPIFSNALLAALVRYFLRHKWLRSFKDIW